MEKESAPPPCFKEAWTRVLDDLDECLQAFDEASTVMALEDGLLFRGHREASWDLKPSLYRHEEALENESNIYQIFATRARQTLNQTRTDWEILTHMQHHGVPTRLLDWSDSFGIAVYFAVLGQKIDTPEDAAVWVLNGYELSKRATGAGRIFSVGVEDFPQYEKFIENIGASGPWPYELPAAIEAPWGHDRIVAQRGLFTVHGTSAEPLNKLITDETCLRKITIPRCAIMHARKYLRLAGIDHYSVFPDLQGLAQNLRQQFCDKNHGKLSKILLVD